GGGEGPLPLDAAEAGLIPRGDRRDGRVQLSGHATILMAQRGAPAPGVTAACIHWRRASMLPAVERTSAGWAPVDATAPPPQASPRPGVAAPGRTAPRRHRAPGRTVPRP